jgi:hypothetical protein
MPPSTGRSRWCSATCSMTDGADIGRSKRLRAREFVIDAYHQLRRIEKSFRMSKHNLQARPVYHHKRLSIDAHLTIVFAALAVSHWIEHQTGWSIRKFVRPARRYRTVQIKAGRQTLNAADRLPRRPPRHSRQDQCR